MLPLFVMAHFTHHLCTSLTSALLPFIRRDFGLNYTQSGIVATAFSLSYGFGQLPAGWLADRIGRRTLLMVGILGVALAGFLIGISNTYLMLIVFLIFMGLCGGGYHPSSAPLISTAVEPKNRGRALGFHTIGGSASFLVAPLAAAAIAAAWGWHWSYIILSIPTAILGLLFFYFLRKRTSESQLKQSISAGAVGEKPPAAGYKRRLTALMTWTIISGAIGGSIMMYMSLYFVDHFHVSEQVAGSLLSISPIAGLFAGPIGGYLSDRFGRVPLIIGGSIIGSIFTFLLGVVPYGIPLFALLFFMGVMSYMRMPVMEAFIMGQTTPRLRSTIYGAYYFVTQEVGVAFAPLVGRLMDRYSFEYGDLLVISAATNITLALICIPFLRGNKE
jgi:MFS family permease